MKDHKDEKAEPGARPNSAQRHASCCAGAAPLSAVGHLNVGRQMKKLAGLFLITLAIASASEPKTVNRSPEEQRSVNQRIFAILDRNGAVEGKTYPFDQIFSSDSEQKIVALREELRRLGYLADDVDRHEKGGVVTYSIDAYQHMEFRRSTLARDSLAMLSLAQKHGVFYDGWGAEIGGKEASNKPATGQRP